jgi:hypothetical protein
MPRNPAELWTVEELAAVRAQARGLPLRRRLSFSEQSLSRMTRRVIASELWRGRRDGDFSRGPKIRALI